MLSKEFDVNNVHFATFEKKSDQERVKHIRKQGHF